LLDVAEGLNFLHASYMIHGDLKGPNILINSNGQACLADCGIISILLQEDSIATYAHGYITRWTPPEILGGSNQCTREADIFSFGMVVIEVFTGKHPFSEFNTPSAIMKVMARERPVHPPGTEKLGFVTQIWDMTVNCWRHDPADRPTTAAVVKFLRECYTLHTADPSLSTLSLWRPTHTTSRSRLTDAHKWSEEKRSTKTGKALWQGIAATIRFRVFAKRTSMEGAGY